MRPLAPFLAAALAHLLGLAAAPAAAQDVGTDVPYVPTPPAVVEAMLRVAGVGPGDVVFDLGSGDGRIVIAAARDFGARGTGVEIDPQLVARARENARAAGVEDRVSFLRQDLFETDLREASVVTLYLLPLINIRLRPRLLDLAPGTRVVSHVFDMDEWMPDEEFFVGDRKVMYWVVPARVAGPWELELPSSPGARVRVSLEQEFQELSGAVLEPGDGTLAVEGGRLDGTALTLTLVERRGGEEVRTLVRGRVEGDRIRGSAEVSGGPAAGTHPWTARRARPAPPLRRPGG